MPPRLPSGTAALESALAQTHISSSTRAFTTTAPLSGTAQRRWRMHQWLRGRGGAIWNDRGQREDPGPRLAGPSADQPFPLNPQFKSEPVLSPLLRGKIFGRIKSKKTEDRKAYLSVSREFGVDVRRVAAVVRLRAVEKEMLRNGKSMAGPYAKIINSWLPQTRYDENVVTPHEPINEITVHPSTQKQLFIPTSESRDFTREDAAKAFHDKLHSADDRSFQKPLIAVEKEIAAGRPRKEAIKKFDDKQIRKERVRHEKRLAREQVESEKVQILKGKRAEIRIRDVATSDVGKDGRKNGTIGWRYGVPHMDRKRGAIKIPTEVPSQRTAPQQ